MTRKELLEKAAHWFRCIAQDAHNITMGNVSHSKPRFIEMDAERAYKEIEEHINDEQVVYVVTRSEEHADYVERVFYNENDAIEHCKKQDELDKEYTRDITETILM